MKRLILFTAIVGLSLHGCAQVADQQAASFENIYATTCLQHLSNLDKLREKLASVPGLPPEQASHFLQGNQGKAWPVPDKHGVFVLAIPDGKNFCAVFARRVKAPEAVSRFQRLVASAPSPLTSRLVQNTSTETQVNGIASTLAYEWSANGAARRMLFTLTTADSLSADIQGLASAAYVQ